MVFAWFALVLASTTPVDTATPATTASLRTVVLGIAARRDVADTHLADALSDVVLDVYAKDRARSAIGRDDIRRVLDLQADRATLGCDSDKCLAEIAQALDAKRIVTGSIDKLAGGYLVTLNELDATSFVAVARGQKQLPLDEALLVAGVRALAEDLLAQSPLGAAGGVVANAGSIDVVTDPRGASVEIGGIAMGKSPTRADNLAVGMQRVRLLRDDYDTVTVEVPVLPVGTTVVNAQMCIARALAQQNLAARRARWRSDDAWHQGIGWAKVGSGALLGAAGGLLALGGVAGAGGYAVVGGLVGAGLGAGVVAWGVIDLLNPPPPPEPEWELRRVVTVTPPSGEVRTVVLQQAPAHASPAHAEASTAAPTATAPTESAPH